MKTKDELPDCPVATTVALIGNKWKLLIIRNLLVRPWRFNELHKSLDGISQKVLTESLRQMEADGIITRTVYPEVPPRVEYAPDPRLDAGVGEQLQSDTEQLNSIKSGRDRSYSAASFIGIASRTS